MIISTLEDSARVEALHEGFAKLFAYVKTHDLRNAPAGRIELDGENLFINNSICEGEPAQQRLLEVHRNYIDIHILLEGEERIGWRALRDLKDPTQPYSAEKDIGFYGDKPSMFIDLLPGQFAVIYPEDPHAPLIGSGTIHKLIAKIKL